jgi:hypothetical protein
MFWISDMEKRVLLNLPKSPITLAMIKLRSFFANGQELGKYAQNSHSA